MGGLFCAKKDVAKEAEILGATTAKGVVKAKLLNSVYAERFRGAATMLERLAGCLSEPQQIKDSYLISDWVETVRVHQVFNDTADSERSAADGDAVSVEGADVGSGPTRSSGEGVELAQSKPFQSLPESGVEEQPRPQVVDDDDVVTEADLREAEADPNLKLKNQVKIKIIISEVAHTAGKKNFRKFISPILSRFDMLPELGMFHSALMIGPWLIEWNNSALCIPRKCVSRAALLSADIEALSTKTEVNGVIDGLARVICEWNTKKLYHDTDSDKNRYGNCQDFVNAVLQEIGIEPQFKGPLATFLDRLRTTGNEKLCFEPDEAFRAKFELQQRNYTFQNHIELDEFANQLIMTDPEFQHKHEHVYGFLKSFDRAFWLKHFKFPDLEEYKPLMQIEEDEDGEPCEELNCPWNNPLVFPRVRIINSSSIENQLRSELVEAFVQSSDLCQEKTNRAAFLRVVLLLEAYSRMSIAADSSDYSSEEGTEGQFVPLLTGRQALSTDIRVLVCCDREFRRALLRKRRLFESVVHHRFGMGLAHISLLAPGLDSSASYHIVCRDNRDDTTAGRPDTPFRLHIEFQSYGDLRLLQWRLADYYIVTYLANDVDSLRRACQLIEEMNDTYSVHEGEWPEGPPLAAFVGILPPTGKTGKTRRRGMRSLAESAQPAALIAPEVFARLKRDIHNAPWGVLIQGKTLDGISDLFEEIAYSEYRAGAVASAADLDDGVPAFIPVPLLRDIPTTESSADSSSLLSLLPAMLGSGAQRHLFVNDDNPDGIYKIAEGIHPFFSTRSARVGRIVSLSLIALSLLLTAIMAVILLSIGYGSQHPVPPWSVALGTVVVVSIACLGLMGLMYSLRLRVQFLADTLCFESLLFSINLRRDVLLHSQIRRFVLKREPSLCGGDHDYVTVCEYRHPDGYIGHKSIHRQSSMENEMRVCRECNLEVLFVSAFGEGTDSSLMSSSD